LNQGLDLRISTTEDASPCLILPTAHSVATDGEGGEVQCHAVIDSEAYKI